MRGSGTAVGEDDMNSREWRRLKTKMTSTFMSTPVKRSTSTVEEASLNLTNSIVGAGIVAIPYAIMQCGMVLGLLLLVALAYVISRVLIMLMECSMKTGKFNLEDLCGHLFGSAGYDLAALLMLLYAYGSMIACLVVIGDTLPRSLDDLFGFEKSKETLVIAVAVAVILPLSLVRNLSSLAWASGLAFLAVVVLVLGVLIVGPHESESQNLSFGVADVTLIDKNVFSGIGILSFHYVCQHSCLLVFDSLESPTLENVKMVSRISLGMVLFFSLLLGLAGCILFGETIDANVLNNFYSISDVIILARMCMAINMIFTYPMECFVVRHACFALFNKYDVLRCGGATCCRYNPYGNRRRGYSRGDSLSDHGSISSLGSKSSGGSKDELDDDGILLGQWSSVEARSKKEDNAKSPLQPTLPPMALHVLFTVLLWTTSLCIALAFDDLSQVLSFSGVVAASSLGYILPVAIYLKTNEIETKATLRRLSSLVCCFSNEGSKPGERTIQFDADLSDGKTAHMNRKIVFYMSIGVFGLCALVIGLVTEILHALSIRSLETDSRANY